MITARTLPLALVLAMGLAGCSATETVEETQSAAHDTTDHVAEAEPEDPYDEIVAEIASRGATDAEEAWAQQRPTLLLFAASW